MIQTLNEHPRYIVDASVIIDLMLQSPNGKKLLDWLIQNDDAVFFTTKYAWLEVTYILCRHLGWMESRNRMTKLKESQYVSLLEDDEDILSLTARYKCQRRLSIPDCFILAAATTMACPALFARKERELMDEMRKKPFDVTILFLDDIFQE